MWRCFVELKVEATDKVVCVEGTPLRIGSDPGESRLVLKHPDIAPVHAVIDVDPDNALWRVFVRSEECEVALLNGLPLFRPQPLHTGDVLSLGPCDIAVLDAGVLCSDSESSRISFLREKLDEAVLTERLRAEVDRFIRDALRPPPAFYELQRAAKEAEAVKAAADAEVAAARALRAQKESTTPVTPPKRTAATTAATAEPGKKKKTKLISK